MTHVSVDMRQRMHLIGWQNTWEQAPGVPRHPFPALMAGETPGRVPVYTALETQPIMPWRDAHTHATLRRRHNSKMV